MPNGGNIVVNGGGSVALGVLSDNGGFEVVVNVDLRDLGGTYVGDIEVAGLGAEAGPARSALAGDGKGRGLAGGEAVSSTTGEVEDVDTEAGVSREDRILARDDGHAEGEQATRGRPNGLEVFAKASIRSNVPDREDTGSRGDSLNRRDELLVVFREDDMANGASGASGGGGLVELEAANSIGNGQEALGLVNSVASDTVDETAVDSTDHGACLVDGKGYGEFTPTANGLPDHLEIGRVCGIDVEHRESV